MRAASATQPALVSEQGPSPEHPRGLALCLSGGGFRAVLFHLGALRRLNELGVLAKVDTISATSGGSILAAHLATLIAKDPTKAASFTPEAWDELVEAPLRALARQEPVPTPRARRSPRETVRGAPDDTEAPRPPSRPPIRLLRHRLPPERSLALRT
jgi:NTE family protein